jgi:hypothetical protein
MAIGYQFDPQWYVEAGEQQLIHDKLYTAGLLTAADVNNGVTCNRVMQSF